MAITRAQLLVSFPEWTNAPEALVNAMITDSDLEVDDSIFGDDADRARMLYVSARLAESPFARETNLLEGEKTESLYWRRFYSLKRRKANLQRPY